VLREAEIEYILKQGDVQVLFFMARVRDYYHLATIQSLIIPGPHNGEVTSERLPQLRYVSLMGITPAGLLEQEGWKPSLLRDVIAAGSAVSDEALAQRQGSVSPSDPATLIYTSGTTGFPKGALLSHRGLVSNAVLTAERLALYAQREGLTRNQVRSCSTFPFFHVAGIVVGMLMPLYEGGTAHPLLAFDPLKVIQVISQEGCQMYIGVPTMIWALLSHPDLDTYDLSSLKVVMTGGAPVPLVMVERVQARIGADVVIIFGQTESSCCLTTTLLEDPYELKATTVGRALPYIDMKIIDPVTAEVAPVGKRGELCARGLLVMAGYYKMLEKTAETIDGDSWLHTGDLATMNAQGYINIVGRIKDMVIRGGENLFPVEIENVLIRHPKVADVQVLGVPDAFFGEELLAVIIPKAGEQVTEQELRDYCKGQISHQKIPRYFQFVESYPLTASGKVQKFVLRERAITVLGLEEVAKTKTA